MSFTRRIAKSALLTAAGAAGVVGAAAGSAQAVDLPQTPDLGGVSNLDNLNGENLETATQSVTGLAGEAGAEVVRTGVPAAGDVASEAAGSLTRSVGPSEETTEVLGKAVNTVTNGELPTEALGDAPTDALGQLPLNNGSLGAPSLGGLPLGG